MALPGLVPGDRWCVVASRWLEAQQAGAAAPVFLAATHERALEVVPLQLLEAYAADVPDDPSSLLCPGATSRSAVVGVGVVGVGVVGVGVGAEANSREAVPSASWPTHDE